MAPHLEPGLELLPSVVYLRTEIAERMLFVLVDGDGTPMPPPMVGQYSVGIGFVAFEMYGLIIAPRYSTTRWSFVSSDLSRSLHTYRLPVDRLHGPASLAYAFRRWPATVSLPSSNIAPAPCPRGGAHASARNHRSAHRIRKCSTWSGFSIFLNVATRSTEVLTETNSATGMRGCLWLNLKQIFGSWRRSKPRRTRPHKCVKNPAARSDARPRKVQPAVTF
jgi:hypothetical protein